MKGEMGGKNGTMNFNVEIERELRIKTRTSSKWGRGFIEISQVNEREVWGGVLHSEIVTPEAGVSDLSREEYSRILRRRRLCKNFPSTRECSFLSGNSGSSLFRYGNNRFKALDGIEFEMDV